MQQQATRSRKKAVCKFPTALDCGIAQVVARHLTAVMQLLSNNQELRSYNFKMRSTKCLNTAVMMMYLMLGRKGISIADQCSSAEVADLNKAVEKKHSISIDRQIANNLITALFRSERMEGSELYYVLLTHSEMKAVQVVGGNEDPTFPGHVFVVERNVGNDGNLKFNLYQSYLYHYDFAQNMQGMWEPTQQREAQAAAPRNIDAHATKNINAEVDGEALKNHLRIIAEGFTRPTWTPDDTKNWESFTHSKNARIFEGRDRSGIHICYQAVTVVECSRQLEILCQNALNGIVTNLKAIADEDGRNRFLEKTWGDAENTAEKENDVMIPRLLNNRDMKTQLMEILLELRDMPCHQGSTVQSQAPEWHPNIQKAATQQSRKYAQASAPSSLQRSVQQVNPLPPTSSSQPPPTSSKYAQASAPSSLPRKVQQVNPLPPTSSSQPPRTSWFGGKGGARSVIRVNDPNTLAKASELISKSTKDTMVLFHSPICGHCLALREDFETAAKQLVARGTNVVDVNSMTLGSPGGNGRSNVLQRAADSTGMTGVPHLVLLGRNGAVKGVYQGDRTAADMVTFGSRTELNHKS